MSIRADERAALKLVGRMLADPAMRPQYEPMIDGPRVVTVVSTDSTLATLEVLRSLADRHEWATLACVDIKKRTIIPVIVRLAAMADLEKAIIAGGDIAIGALVAAMERPTASHKFPGLTRSDAYLVAV